LRPYIKRIGLPMDFLVDRFFADRAEAMKAGGGGGGGAVAGGQLR